MKFLKRLLAPKIPPEAKNTERRALDTLTSGESNEAEALLQTVIAADPANGEAYQGLGMLYLRRFTAKPDIATLNEAVQHLTKAVELLPESAESYYYLAFAESFTLDTSDEAEQHLAQALRLAPELADRAAEIQQRIATAKTGLQQQAIDPATLHEAVQRYENGQTLAAQGRHAEAITAYEDAIGLYPAYAEALLALGEAYRRLDRTEDALRVLRRTLAVRPNMFDAHVALGSIFVQRGEHERALEQLTLALQQAPDQPQVLRNVGLLQLATRKPDDAAATFRRLAALQPGDPEPRLHLALAAAQTSDHAAARDALSRITDHTLTAKQHQLAAQIYEQLGDTEAAQYHGARASQR